MRHFSRQTHPKSINCKTHYQNYLDIRTSLRVIAPPSPFHQILSWTPLVPCMFRLWAYVYFQAWWRDGRRASVNIIWWHLVHNIIYCFVYVYCEDIVSILFCFSILCFLLVVTSYFAVFFFVTSHFSTGIKYSYIIWRVAESANQTFLFSENKSWLKKNKCWLKKNKSWLCAMGALT